MLNNSTLQAVRYGGFWLRLLAAIIDSFLLSIILLPLLWAVYGTAYFNFPQVNIRVGTADIPIAAQTLSYQPVSILFTWVLPMLAVLIFWHFKSATPGKIVCSLIIVDADTLNPPGIMQSVIRYISYYVSAIPFFLGFFWIAFDKRKQGWHDKIANTIVIHRSDIVTKK